MTHVPAFAQPCEDHAVRVLGTVADAYLAVDRGWRVTAASPEAGALLRMTEREWVGEIIWAKLPGLRGSAFEAALRQTVEQQVATVVVSLYKDHDRWYELRSYPAAEGVAIYLRDVTELRMAEAARVEVSAELERAKRIYETALSNTADLNFVFSLQGRLTYANPALLTLWGKPLESVVGCSLSELGYPAEVAERMERQIQEVIAGRESVRDEIVHTCTGGARDYEYILVPVVNVAGAVEAVAGSARDITERNLFKERLARVIREAPCFMCVLRGPEHIIELANDHFCEHLGKGDIVGRKLLDALPELEDQMFPDLLDYVYRTGTEYVGKATPIRLQRAALGPPEERFVDFVYHPLRDAAGVVTGILIQGMDITERLRSEEELRARESSYRRAAIEATSAAEANAKFRVFFEQGVQFAAVLSLDGSVIEANRQFMEVCGVCAADVARQLFWDCSCWSRSAGVRERVRRAVAEAANRQVLRQETEYHAADGSARVMDLLLAPASSEAGRVLFVVATGTDITERKRAETALRQSEARLRQITDSVPVLIWETGEEGLTFANRHYLDFFGCSFEQVRGLGWATFVHPDDLERSRREYEEVYARREGRVTQARMRRHDGEYRWLMSSGFPHFDEKGRLVGFVGSSVDVTDLKHAEETQREAAGKLALADRQKDEFLALLAHELRNPLAPLQSGLQMLDLANDDPATLEHARAMMERQLSHMVRLIDDLLDVSRVVTNKMELRRTDVSLAEIVRNAVETAKPAIAVAEHELVVSLPPEPIYLHADLTRMAQVISNLLINSAKYTPVGGRISLAASVRECELAVVVEDNGIGIPREALNSIFNMFSQVDRSIERATGGLGIGLALVKGLVELHGGTVSAESAGPGRGSRFTVRLPLAAPAAPAREAVPARVDVGPVSKFRILVVDDHRDAALGMAAVLRRRKHEVKVAHSGAEALAAGEQFRPEVILMDIGMPGMNGYDATRAIRATAWGKEAFIVAATGWGQETDRARSREAGCDAHLVKPVRLAELDELLARVRSG